MGPRLRGDDDRVSLFAANHPVFLARNENDSGMRG